MNLLEVKNASKAFGSLIAVRDVSLAVKPGELRAVIGPNGAGKTTFFNLISGFLHPTSGSVVFDGRDVTALPAHERVKIGMARTFQITEIFPELTVHENVQDRRRGRGRLSPAALDQPFRSGGSETQDRRDANPGRADR